MNDIAIVILSYNTKKITLDCLKKLENSLISQNNIKSEIIVIDNASSDGTIEELQKYIKKENIKYKFFFLKKNIGFTKGNNFAASKADSKFLLFLNSDVLIETVDWSNLINKFCENSNLGALTVRVNLNNGQIDPASHRGIPTPWRSFCYFLRLEKIANIIPFLKKYFGGYHLTYLDFTAEHEVEVISGAFLFIKASIFKELKGFDEDFFMYGEDIDLSYRILNKGYKILYYPKYFVTHLKYQSGKQGTFEGQKIAKYHFFKSMDIFYKKHFKGQNNKIINKLVEILFSIITPSKI